MPLFNGDLDRGMYRWHFPDIGNVFMPNGFDFWYQQEDVRLARMDDWIKWDRPEAVLLHRGNLPDEPELFPVNEHSLKVFKGSGANWWAISQTVDNLSVGRHRFSVDLFPDIVENQVGRDKTFAPDPLNGEFRFYTVANEFFTRQGWADGATIPFGKYTTLILDYDNPIVQSVTFGIECRGRWPVSNVGWWINRFALEKVDAPQPEPTPEPMPDTTELERKIAALEERAIQLEELITLNLLRIATLEGKHDALRGAWEATIAGIEQLIHDTRELLAGRVP